MSLKCGIYGQKHSIKQFNSNAYCSAKLSSWSQILAFK